MGNTVRYIKRIIKTSKLKARIKELEKALEECLINNKE